MRGLLRSLADAARAAYGRWLDLLGHWRFRRLGLGGLWRRRPDAALSPVWSDLWFLYDLTKRRRPRVVLEFGSGCSTIAFAQALSENARAGTAGRIYSLEADAGWAAVTTASLPEELRGLTEVIACEAEPAEYAGTPVWRHSRLPEVTPELIYVDGPALDSVRKAAVDVIEMQDRLPVGCAILVDGRSRQVAFFDRNWRRKVSKRRDPVLRSTLYIIEA